MSIKFGVRLSKTSKNTIVLFASQLYNKFIAVLFFPIAARILGVADFGKFTLVLTFISLFYIFSDWGLSILTIRNVARSPDQTREYLIHTLALRIALAGIFYLFLLGLAFWLAYPTEIKILISIVGISLFTNNILASFNAIFSAYEKMHIPSILGIIFSTIYFTLVILCLLLRLGLTALISVTVFTSLLNAILTGWFLREYLVPFRFPLNYNFYREILKQATPFAVLSVLSIIYFKIDTIMLSKLKTMESVGLYNAAYKIVEFLRFIPVSLLGAYFPKMSRQAKHSTDELRKTYFKTTKLLLTFILPVAFICSFYANYIILFLFGPSFIPAASALRILIWAVVIMFINAPVGNILYNSNKLYKFIPFAVLNTSLNIILNFIFIPRWSYIGASATTLITEITGFFVQIWFVKEILFKK